MRMKISSTLLNLLNSPRWKNRWRLKGDKKLIDSEIENFSEAYTIHAILLHALSLNLPLADDLIHKTLDDC